MSKYVHRLVFKCRNCGTLFVHDTGSEYPLQAFMGMVVLCMPVDFQSVEFEGHFEHRPVLAPMHYAHQCYGAGVWGIGDLIRGLEKQE